MTITAWVVVGFVLATSAGLLISRDWRLELGLLGLQYLGVFWLTNQHWPISMAAIKLVTGWMAIATLGITRLNLKDADMIAKNSGHRGAFSAYLLPGLLR